MEKAVPPRLVGMCVKLHRGKLQFDSLEFLLSGIHRVFRLGSQPVPQLSIRASALRLKVKGWEFCPTVSGNGLKPPVSTPKFGKERGTDGFLTSHYPPHQLSVSATQDDFILSGNHLSPGIIKCQARQTVFIQPSS